MPTSMISTIYDRDSGPEGTSGTKLAPGWLGLGHQCRVDFGGPLNMAAR